MNQLRRKFANLWKREEGREDGSDHQHLNVADNGQNLSRRSSASSAEVPAALEIDAAAATAADIGAGVASSPRGRRQDQQHLDAESKEEGAEEEPPPPRLLSLAYPWGTSDSRPPPGWKSSCSSQPISREQRRSHNRNGSGGPRASGRGGPAAAAGVYLSSHVDLGVPAPPPAAVAAAAASGGDGGRRRRGSEEGGEGGEEEGRQDCGYRRSGSYRNASYRGGNGSVSASKRQRAAAEEGRLLAADGRGRGGGGDGDVGDDGERRQHAARRRRTCPADSTFVSPAAKRSVSYCASATAGGGGGDATAAEIVAADLEDHDEDLRRSSTSSRLIFRAGFFKALRGSRAAAKRARSATKLKRKTRELQAAIARREFHSAHPPQEKGPGEDAGGGGGGGRETKEGERAKNRGREVGGTLGGVCGGFGPLRDEGDTAALIRRRCERFPWSRSVGVSSGVMSVGVLCSVCFEQTSTSFVLSHGV